jgi:hypothetical protein
MGRLWRISGTQTSPIFQLGRCIRSLFGEARCGWLCERNSPLARDQPERLSRKGRQRLGLAAATIRRPAKHTDRRSTRKEKIAPLPRKTGLADAEDYSPKKSLSQGSLSSFCGAEVSSPSGQKPLRDDSQARWVAVASLAKNGFALAPGFLRSALAER